MQPPATDVLYSNTRTFDLLLQMICSHGADFLKDFPTILMKQSILSKRIPSLRARYIPKIRANVVGIKGKRFGAYHFPGTLRAVFGGIINAAPSK